MTILDDHPGRAATLRRRRLLALLAAAAAAGRAVRPGAARAADGVQPAVPEPEAGEQELGFGVIPFLPPLLLDRKLAAVTGALSRDIDRPLRLRTAATFEIFADGLGRASYDLAFLHPFLQAAAARAGYEPLARLDEPLRLVVLAPEDAPAPARLEDLRGRRLALPPPLAAVSQMALLALARVGMVPGVDLAVQHYPSKLSCFDAVMLGNADACGFSRAALGEVPLGEHRPIRIIDGWSLGVGMAVAAHARVPGAERARVRDALTGWSSREAGRAVLAAAGWSGFVPARGADFADLGQHLVRERGAAA